MKRSTISAKPKAQMTWWAAAFWLLVWEAAARFVNEPILLVSPVTAITRLIQLAGEAAFWRAIGFSVGKILMGFGCGAVLGVALAALAYRFRIVRQLMAPLTATLRAVPVASFVILALLWVSSSNLSILITLLITFPILYTNVLSGLDATDPRLIEMARLFRVPFHRQLTMLYADQVIPYVRSALNVAVGLSWKSGIAAEVIGVPSGSIGEKLYKAKVYLETPDLFCWTLVVVLVSIGCEKLLAYALTRLTRRRCG